MLLRQSDNNSLKMHPVVNNNLKYLTCVNCKHVFSFRGGQFRGKIPFLLKCGHAICEICVRTRPIKNCGTCGLVFQHNLNERANFSINVYVLGLMSAGQYNAVNSMEPNIEFQQPAAARFNKCTTENQEHCSECGLKADYRCRQCQVFFCNTCYAKIHGRALQGHQKVSAAENASDIYHYLMSKCKEHPNETIQFHCTQCDVPACTHCAFISHHGHTLTSKSPKSTEIKAQIEDAMDKLAETLQRVKMAEKKLVKPSTSMNSSQNNDLDIEEIEAKITKHFTYLHGVLQNIENRFMNQLRERRNCLGNNINAVKEQLKLQKEEVEEAMTLAVSALNSDAPLNTVALIDKLEEALCVPCHLVYNSCTDEKIELNIDESVVNTLEEHCCLYLPEISSYSLARAEDLPDDYEIEPLVREEIPKPAMLAIKAAPLSSSRNSLYASTYSLRSVSDSKPSGCLVAGSSEAVIITHIKDPSCFYTQSACRSLELTKLQKSLDQLAITSVVPTKLELNKMYLVQYGNDMNWYRGRVKTITTDSKNNLFCDIFYVDYGNTESKVPIRRMRNMAVRSSLVPIMAKQCSLYDIVPREGQWEVEANKAMYEMIEGQSNTIMHIFKVQNDVHHVDITKNSVGDGDHTLSVRDALIFLEYGCFISNERLRKINPQSWRTFYEEEIAVETLYDIRVTHIENPDCIHIQKFVGGITHITKLTEDMNREYGNIVINKGIIYTPQVGMPCAVRYSDGSWYRGRISNLLGNRKVEVFFVDFGDTRVFNYDEIRRLHQKFMTVNALAFKVSLKDVVPLKNKEWSSEVKDFMDAQLLSTYLKIFVFSKGNDSYQVCLYIPKDQADLNFNAILVKEGFASSTGPSSQYVITPNVVSKKRKRKVSKATKATKVSHANGDDNLEDEAIDESDPFRMQIHILQVESPDSIYVSDVKSVKAAKKMTKDIQNFYNKFKSVESEDWEKDSICIAYSAKDKSYHRAKILQIIPPEEVEVLLYDIGITEKVTLQDLQSLNPKFSILPPKAFKIKLAGILPCGGTSAWLSSSCEMLSDLINENQHSRFYITKMAGTETDAIPAELWVRETRTEGPLAPTVVEINSINKKLVKNGVALPVRGYKDDVDKVLAIELRQQLSQNDEKGSSTFSVEWVAKNEDITCSTSAMSENSAKNSVIAMSESDNVSGDENANEDADIESEEGYPIPPPLSAWIPPVPIRNDKFCAIATNVDNDCVIYLHSVEQNSDTLAHIDATLQAHFGGSKPQDCDMEWAPNDLCVAQFHADQKWYRARVLEVLDNNEVKVIYVDYGNIDECKLGSLRKRVITGHIPIQATRCLVQGLIADTPDGKWTTPELDVIHALVVDKKNDVTVLQRNSDHLVISITLRVFGDMNLVSYLRHNLGFNIRDLQPETQSQDDNGDDNFDHNSLDTADVVIEEYVDNYMPNTIAAPTMYNLGLTLEPASSGENKNEICDDVDIGSMNISDKQVLFVDLEIGTENSHSDCLMLSDDPEQISSCDSISFEEAIIVSSTPPNEENYEFVPSYKCIDVPDDVDILNLEPVHVDNPTVFFARLDETSQVKMLDAYEQQFKSMTKYMDLEAYNPPRLEKIRLHSPCSARYTADGRWYRAMITEISPNSKEVKVQYVDYGNSEYQPIDKIHTLADKWLALPMMSLKCKLWRVRPNPNNTGWKNCIDKFRGVFYRGPVTAKIKDRCSGTLDVELYPNEDCAELLYNSLLETGLLEPSEE